MAWKRPGLTMMAGGRGSASTSTAVAVATPMMSEGRARLDFDLPDPIDKEAVTEALNKLIQQDQPRHFRWITDEELQSQPELVRTMSVSPPMGQG